MTFKKSKTAGHLMIHPRSLNYIYKASFDLFADPVRPLSDDTYSTRTTLNPTHACNPRQVFN